jgi:CheY-like chemotaxis protein
MNPELMSQKPRIVVVNDEPWILEMVELLLGMHLKDAQVLLFGKPEDALAELAASDPDLLISDTIMPKLNVLDILEFLKKRGAKYPVIVMTTGMLPQDAILKFGEEGVLLRLISVPFRSDSFVRLVKQCLGYGAGEAGAMTAREFDAAYPQIYDWIKQTLAVNAPRAQSVASLGFPRLAQYFSPELLAAAKVVYVDAVSTPPLAEMGLERFTGFFRTGVSSITYLDTIIVHNDFRAEEALHFHEMVHVVQWQLLGPKSLLMAYADGLEGCGYRNGPLEVMAYMLESVFRNSAAQFDVAKVVREQLWAMDLMI